jgi:predicted ATP-grasp superfamily ATP-dependent carboligase
MKILLIGVSARGLAESAVNSGYSVIALDAFGDLDLNEICESYSLARDYGIPYSAAGLYKASRRLQFDAIAYTSNLENYPQVVGRFARHHDLLGNPQDVLKRVRHWPSLYGVLDEAGFNVPETIFHANGRRTAPGRTWLNKPLRSGGGHAVSFAPSWASPKPGYLLQEYISGIPCSASFVSNGQQAVILGLSEQLVGRTEFGSHGFRYCGNLAPLAASADRHQGPSILDQVARIAQLLTQEFGLVGVNGFDFILKDGRVFLTEVNPRYSASMELIEKAYSLSIFDLHVQAVTQGTLPESNRIPLARTNHPRFYGKAILYAQSEIQTPDSRRWLQMKNVRDIPHAGEKIPSGKPVCTLLAEGQTRRACFTRLTASVEAIKGEIYA